MKEETNRNGTENLFSHNPCVVVNVSDRSILHEVFSVTNLLATKQALRPRLLSMPNKVQHSLLLSFTD